MQITLKDLRSMAAMAQFSPREIPAHVLRVIEDSAHLAGEAMISIDADSARVIEPAPKVS
jgi:hypothetical protein